MTSLRDVSRPRRKQLKTLDPPHRVNRVTRIGEPKVAVKVKDHDSCLLVHWVPVDMREVLNDLQTMDVDARSSENGVYGRPKWRADGSLKSGIPQPRPLNDCQQTVVSATSNWTQTERSRVQVYEFPPPRLRRRFRF
ncbi:hypothetical protein K443DRAFT_677885, partial [Laccaria amethystina LaAM-08-1]